MFIFSKGRHMAEVVARCGQPAGRMRPLGLDAADHDFGEVDSVSGAPLGSMSVHGTSVERSDRN